MSKSVIVAAAALLLVGLLAPTEGLAQAFADGDAARMEQLARGVLVLKGTLAALALLLVLAARFAPRGATSGPIVASGIRAAPAWRASTLWAIGGLLVLALVLRAPALGLGLSFDEIDTLVHYARLPLARVVSTFDSQNQHLLYSVLARLAFELFGESGWAVRLPAVVLGVASIAALYRFALRVADPREAIFAATLLSVSYHHVWFSQNARGYTGLLLFTLLGSSAFLDMLRDPQPRGLAAPLRYGLWMALATLIHATAVFAVAAHGLVWLGSLWTSRGRNARANHVQVGTGFVLAGGLSLVLYSLVLPQFFATLLAPTMPGAKVEWKNPSWLVLETLRGLSNGVPGGGFTLAGGLVIVILGVRSYAKQSLAVLGTFTLGLVVTAVTLLATKHNLWPRMFFFAAGFAVLIAIRGVTEWARIFSFGQLGGLVVKLGTAALAVACLMSAATVPTAWNPKQDFEGPLELIARERLPGDAVATVDMTVMPYAEYFNSGWPAVDSIEALQALEASHARTWIVYCTPTRMKAAQPEIWSRLERDYAVVGTFWGTLGGSEVVVVRRDAAAR